MAKTTHNARPVNEISPFNSQVDIIVPFHGQYDLVMQLINSLFRLTRSNFYNLILVDDCSPNSEFILKLGDNARKNSERLNQKNILKTIRNEEQKGFAV
jgi:glycosyltransferase involved in cell wall biosynthesis